MTPREKIDKWYVAPLRDLQKLGKGDEGFLVMMVSLALAERLVETLTSRAKKAGTKISFEAQGGTLFGLPEDQFSAFWQMFRNGMMHFGQPFSGTFGREGEIEWDWDLSDQYGALPEIIKTPPNFSLIRIDPWKWLELVLEKWGQHPELLDLGDCRKLGGIHRIVGNPVSAPLDTHQNLPNVPKFGLRTGSRDG